ncbi:6-carboxytetrahydropterin synthase [bacterium]|nr:6-carboxytetrahydropterin synthase [bacterium]
MKNLWNTGTLFIKELDILDCAVYSEEHGIIGTSWHVDVEVEGQLDENGFVYDFSHTKKLVKNTLKNTLDHALILPSKNKNIDLSESGGTVNLSITTPESTWKYKAPKQAIYTVEDATVNAETVSREAEKVILKDLPDTVVSVKVRLYEEEVTDGSSIFRYTHGLPHHKGLCQRLFHGHRSKIVVLKNDVKCLESEELIANSWFNKNVHIAEPGQFKSKPWDVYTRGSKGEYAVLSYEAEEGYFEAEIPAEKVFIVEQATSIESIAQGLCKVLKNNSPESNFTVIPHEGINKGGIARS